MMEHIHKDAAEDKEWWYALHVNASIMTAQRPMASFME